MSYLLRVYLQDRPGSLGLLAVSLGSVGADILSLDVVERGEGYAVRMRLRSGCIAAARAVVGRPPLLSRALAGPVELGWPSGRYRAWPLESLAGKAGGALLPLDVRASGDGHCVLDWPDSAPPYLAVALGPHDLPDARLADA